MEKLVNFWLYIGFDWRDCP